MTMIITAGDHRLQLSLTPDGTCTAPATLHAQRFDHGKTMHMSNLHTPPHVAIDRGRTTLMRHEVNLIEKLLDACSYYDDQGDPVLSNLVDKIGMTLMQSFLSRDSNMRHQKMNTGAIE